MSRAPSLPRAPAAVVVVLAVTSLLACGGDVAPTAPPAPETPAPPAAPTNRLTTTPESLTCTVGQTVALEAALSTPSAGTTFTFAAANGNVSVGTPAGSTASVACLVAGTSTVTITAAGQTVTVPVTISAPAVGAAIASWGAPQRLSPFGVFGDAPDADFSVRALWGTSASDVFAATSTGAIQHFDGTSWTPSGRGTVAYEAISGSSATDVYAVGFGVVSRFDGRAWSDAVDVPAESLWGVWASPGLALAVGGNGTILRSTGGNRWTAMSSGVVTPLYAVWASGTTAFAVGDSGGVLRNTAATTGGSWEWLNFPTQGTLVGVWGTDPSNVYVTDATNHSIYHYDGSSFTLVASDVEVGVISGASARDITTTGLGAVTHFDGTRWTSRPISQKKLVEAVWVGDGVTMIGGADGYTAVQRGTNAAFTTLTLYPAWRGVWAASPSFAMAVGPGEQTMRWDGTQWAPVPIPTSEGVLAVWGTTATDVFAAGDEGNVFRFDGSSWTKHSPPSVFLGGLWGTASTDVFAVGDGIYHYDGGAWTTMDVPLAAEHHWLYAVSGSGSRNVVAVGHERVVLRFDGTSWSVVQGPQGSGSFDAVWVADDSTAYLGADDGTLFRLSGDALTPLGRASACGNLTGLWGSRATDVYMVNYCGEVFRFDGAELTFQSSAEAAGLLGISGLPTGGGWAVGDGAAVLRGIGPSDGAPPPSMRAGFSRRAAPVFDARRRLVRGGRAAVR